MTRPPPALWTGLLFGLLSGALVCAGPVLEWLNTPDAPPPVGHTSPVTLRAKAGVALPPAHDTPTSPTTRSAPVARPARAAPTAPVARPASASRPAPAAQLAPAARPAPVARPARAAQGPSSARSRAVPRGQVLLGPGEAVTPALWPVIHAALTAAPRESPAALAARLGLLLGALVLLVVLSRQRVRDAPRPGRCWALMILFPGLSAASVHAVALLSPLPLGLAPAALAAIACGLVLGRSAALLAAAATVVFVGAGQGAGPELVWAIGAGALTAGLLAAPRRIALVLPAGLAGALLQGGLLALAPPPSPFGADWPFLQIVGLSAAGPLAAGLLTLLGAWPLLGLAGTASARRLRRVSSPRHPLLRELRRRAPGTFRHSVNVAKLAEAGGRALGADVTLLRAAALYHDVGKLAGPGFFAENLADQPDPHEALTPGESARRLRQHVRDGLFLAKRFRLPAELWAGITEHHGTALVLAPARRARAAGEALDPTVFHYPGPLPRSRESAILMVADAVEGASRRLDDPSLARVSAVVEEVVDRLMTEYQFEDCELGQVELVILQETLVHALRHTLHRRRVDPARLEETP